MVTVSELLEEHMRGLPDEQLASYLAERVANVGFPFAGECTAGAVPAMPAEPVGGEGPMIVISESEDVSLDEEDNLPLPDIPVSPIISPDPH